VGYATVAATSFPQEIARRFDIVGVDQRGVGGSTPKLTCLSDDELDDFVSVEPDSSPGHAAEMATSGSRFADSCYEHSRMLMSNLSANVVAQDTDIVRSALGAQQISYLGKSYGSFQGLVYASQYPSRVRRLVLDGVVNPEVSAEAAALDQAASLQRNLVSFVDDCVARTCPLGATRGSARSALTKLLAHFPVQGSSGDGAPQMLGRIDAAAAIAAAMYDPAAGWPALRQALEEALEGDNSTLTRMAAVMRGRTNEGWLDTYVASVVINCVDRPHADSVGEYVQTLRVLKARSPQFGALVAQSELPCVFVRSTAPVSLRLDEIAVGPLLIGNRDDPATPYLWAAGVRARVPSSHLITVESNGHTAFAMQRSSCVDEHVVRYLTDMQSAGTDAICKNGYVRPPG
jgi:pimeloyl-ACP methyl ester carboxylesterase